MRGRAPKGGCPPSRPPAYQGLARGERLQVPWPRQFGDEVFRVHVDLGHESIRSLCTPPFSTQPHFYPTYPHLALPWAQVEVQAALEALLDEAVVGGHRPQARESVRQEVELPLTGLLLLPRQALWTQW